MRKLQLLAVSLGLVGVFALAPATVAADDVLEDVCNTEGASESAACQNRDGELTGPDGLIMRVANIVAVVAGLLAVIIMVFAGFTYITSSGDSSKLTNARNTIIYAAIGLLVIILAQALVGFVLNRIG